MCPYCNVFISGFLKYCTGCGEELDHASVCQNCDNLVAPSWKICGRCGTKINHNSEPASTSSAGTQPPQQDSSILPVVFPDANLEAEILGKLGRTKGPIPSTDLSGISDLRLEKLSIQNITGLEHLTNLETLWLNPNQIKDITPLKTLTKLTWLGLGNNQIKDVTPLKTLTKLTWLTLRDNQVKETKKNHLALSVLSQEFFNHLSEKLPDITINGSPSQRHPGNLNIRFPDFEARDLLQSLQPVVAASTGSACSTGVEEPSYVLKALGLSTTEASECVRFSFGVDQTRDTIMEVADFIGERVLERRALMDS